MRVLPGLEAPTSTGVLGPALALSVALHVAVLAGVPELANYSATVPLAPLNARIAPLDAPRADAAPAAVERPARAAAAVPPRPEPRAAATPRASRAEPVPVPARPIAREEVAAVSVPPAQAAPPAVAPVSAEPASAAGEPAANPRPAPEAIDPGSLAQYRLALIGAARRHKLYPDEARSRGLEGRVAVELVIGADGTLAAAQVRQSSGHSVLDREALEMLKRAAALTPVPPSLRSREFRLDVPVLFELRNG